MTPQELQPRSVDRKQLARRTRRGFLSGLALYGLGYAGWRWIRSRPEELGLAWPFRRVLSANESIWRRFFSPSRTAPLPPAPAVGTPPRVNGDVGLEEYV